MAWAADIGQSMAITFTPWGASGTLIGVTPPVFTRDMLDVTDHGSAHRWRTFMDGLIDAGECVFEVLFDPAFDVVTAMASAAAVITIAWPLMGLSTAGDWQCSAYISEVAVDAPIDDAVKASITAKLSGLVTFAAPA